MQRDRGAGTVYHDSFTRRTNQEVGYYSTIARHVNG